MRLCWVTFLGFLGVVLSEFLPKITVTQHEQVFQDLLYFDDSSNVMVLRDNKLQISFDDGVSFQQSKVIGDSQIAHMFLDTDFKDRAFALSLDKTQYVTNDKGKSWSKFDLSDPPSPDHFVRFTTNAENRDLVILELNCRSSKCESKNYYTENGFKDAKPLPVNGACRFAFDKVYCSNDEYNNHGHVIKSELFKSDNFFKSKQVVDNDSFNSGIILGLDFEEGFMIAVIQHDRYDSNSKTNILISKDGERFQETDLQVKSRHGMLSLLHHSPQSLFIGIAENVGIVGLTSTLYSSDSTGLKLNKLLDNIVNFAIVKIQTIKGGWLANVGELGSPFDFLGGPHNVKSYFSIDDGKSWDLLKVNNDDDCKVSSGCSLHIESPYVISGDGRTVTGPTPAILMAVGNKGSKLETDLRKLSTWISRDGGISWDQAIDLPGQFTFGDQGNVIVLIPWGDVKDKPSEKFYYSLDQGKSWSEESLEVPIWGIAVFTTIDGSSTKFIFNGLRDSLYGTKSAFYTIDFGDAFNGNICKDDDFEEVYSRVEDGGEPLCLYGQKEKFKRRKQDAKCFVNKLFEDVISIEDKCECTIADFECALGFVVSPKSKDACVPDPKAIASICSEKNLKDIEIPDKALISLNPCELKKPESEFIVKQKFKCSEYSDYKDGDEKTKGDISIDYTDLEGSLSQFIYTEEFNETGLGENIILRTTDNIAYASNNGGDSFVKISAREKIMAVYSGYTRGKIILITDENLIYISDDGGDTFHRKETPTQPGRGKLLSFHKTDKDKFIWYGCESADCRVSTAYYTIDNGANFKKLKDNVLNCDFIAPHLELKLDENKDLVYCTIVQDGKLALGSAQNLESDFDIKFDHVKGYAITGKFVVIATVDEKANALKASITVDGTTFAAADFPSDINIKAHQAYTILDSATHAIFMHITSDAQNGKERGVLLKSNFNGTSYVLSVDDVNRDSKGYVDFDRIDQIEGSIVINRAFVEGNQKKKIKTQISHNDGAEWSYLIPPRLDSNGKKFDCVGKSLEKCSLNLHGYTERADFRDTFSSTSAVGVMFGVGNVGESLSDDGGKSTFMTRDGGVTWRTVKEGEYMWEFGDRGTILVLVNSKEETDTLLYSLDDGFNWIDYKFSEEKVKVLDIATSPTDTSTKFVLFVKSPKHQFSTRAIGIDFANVYKRQCQLDLDNPDKDDYEFFSPSHPLSADDCLFGHQALYLRRASDKNDCFIGSAPLEDGFKVTQNCTCTRRDYECDYNYYRDKDNTCKLVKGLTPESRKKEMCDKDGAFQYFKPTGYRKIPLSTCVGGKGFDSWDAQPCPGKEKEFNEYYGRGINKSNIWLVLGIPIFVLLFTTWFVYDRGIRRNGGFARFGQIRLDGDDDFQPIEDNQIDVVVNKIVKGGIITVAATYAGIKAVLRLDKALLLKVTSLLFRNSLGRRNYVSVPHLDEEDELFGDFRDNYEEEMNDESNDLNEGFAEYNDDVAELENSEPNAESSADSRLFNIDDDEDSQYKDDEDS